MEEVSTGSFIDYPQSFENREEILEDVRETLHESISEAISVGKELVNQLRYPLTEFTEAIDADGVIEEFESLIEAISRKRQEIEEVVERFGQMLHVRSSAGDFHPVEVVQERPLLVEVYEKEVPVTFANEAMEEKGVESRMDEGVRDSFLVIYTLHKSFHRNEGSFLARNSLVFFGIVFFIIRSYPIFLSYFMANSTHFVLKYLYFDCRKLLIFVLISKVDLVKLIADLQEITKKSTYSDLSYGLNFDEACAISDEHSILETQLQVNFSNVLSIY